MQVVIQKVKNAKVTVDNQITGSIQEGFVLLVGLEDGDTIADVSKAAEKIANMRIFEDEDGKINESLHQHGGEVLSISQFTLAANVRKGNRPSFTQAMHPDEARTLFSVFNEQLEKQSLKVETGVFQAHMNVELDNDGPVTIILRVRDGKVL